jgi:hypothetical protein
MHKKLRSLFILLALTAIVPTLALSLMSKTPAATASTSDNVSGYAWSKYGYMFLNCTTQGTCGANSYGVTVSPTGQLSGFSWSPNIGWINFSGGTLSCGATPTANRTLSGTATVTYANISPSETLSLASIQVLSNGQVDPSFKYAWGSGYLGWVDFSQVQFSSGSSACSPLSLTATPATVSTGGTTSLTWSDPSTTYTQCRPLGTSNKNTTTSATSTFSTAGSLAAPTGTYASASVPGYAGQNVDFQVECLTSGGTWVPSSVATVTIGGTGPCPGPSCPNPIILSAAPASVFVSNNQVTNLTWALPAQNAPVGIDYCEPVQTATNGTVMNVNTSHPTLFSNFRSASNIGFPTTSASASYTGAKVPGINTETVAFMVHCRDTSVTPVVWYDSNVVSVPITTPPPPPTCQVSRLLPSCINKQTASQNTTFTWDQVTNAASSEVRDTSGTVFPGSASGGSMTVPTPTYDTRYDAYCTNSAGVQNTTPFTVEIKDGPCTSGGKLQIKEH